MNVPSFSTIRKVQTHLYAYSPTVRREFVIDKLDWTCEKDLTAHFLEFETVSFREVKQCFDVTLNQHVTIDGEVYDKRAMETR